MNFNNIEIPSNKKFGFFFSSIFLIISSYFAYKDNTVIAYMFAILAILFLAITLIRADILLPLNKLWMRFGLLLGMIVSPIVLGIIFFGLFTPIAIIMRLIGRDELRIKINKKDSHWIKRDPVRHKNSFKYQF
jgi:hypothetical protein